MDALLITRRDRRSKQISEHAANLLVLVCLARFVALARVAPGAIKLLGALKSYISTIVNIHGHSDW